MILGVGAILLLVILVYAIMTLRSEATYLADLSRREAELIAAVAERTVVRAMTEGKSEEVQAILEQIGELPHLAGIRIVGPNGAILRSSRRDEQGRNLAQRDRSSDETFRPILNGPACYRCHPEDQATLGFLNVRISSPSIESQVARPWTFVILPAVSALIAAGGLIALYFTLVVGRRIDTISRTMSRVEAGDLTAKVPEGERDELGRLGKSFNAMVARLAEAQQHLQDRHAKEIRRAEHLASLGKMAAGIAHEINNPLAGMQNCARTLLKGVRDERQRVQYLEMLQEGLGRIGRTVRQLLDFAREAKPQLAETTLTPLLHRCLAFVEHELATRKIGCSVSLDAALPTLLADPYQLEQVFLNILMNALEAMPNGGTLTITAGVCHREGGPFVEAAVTDTGAGIPPENLPRVFDPFFTTKEVGKGTGLGLSVSYGIVRAHGGFIDVQSEVGKGTTFTIALPAAGG
jgi:signal transduction histidine kinase